MRRLDGWLFLLALLVGAACIGFFSARYLWAADWSVGARASIAPESRAVLDRLPGPVEVVSYASPAGDLRANIGGFFERYQRAKPDLTLRFVDPERDPAAMRELGISTDGAMLFHYHERVQRLDDALTERNVSNALERLTRGGERIVAFVTGDGERLPNGVANADLGVFMAQFQARGIRAVPLNFGQVQAVPEHTDLVVLASPLAALSPVAVKALVAWLDNGGNLLWLTEPGDADLGTAPLAVALGVRVLPGMLVDAQGAALNVADPRQILQTTYTAHPITHGLVQTTLFPQVAALARAAGADWTVGVFLHTGEQSRIAFDAVNAAQPAAIRVAAEQGEMHGPFDFGFALTRLSPSPVRNEQRAVVVGDGDFLANSFVGNGGNRALGERIIDWLLGDDALVDLPPRGAPDRVLVLSQGTLNALTAGFLFVLPLALFLVGATITWRRRRR
jgi:hypothetical protein